MGAQHALIAGQFLVMTQARGGSMHEWIEPEHAAPDGHQGIHPRIAMPHMRVLVSKHQTTLVQAVTVVHIGRQHDARVQHADDCGQPGHRLRPQQARRARFVLQRTE